MVGKCKCGRYKHRNDAKTCFNCSTAKNSASYCFVSNCFYKAALPYSFCKFHLEKFSKRKNLGTSEEFVDELLGAQNG